jgi:hypothetical protein
VSTHLAVYNPIKQSDAIGTKAEETEEWTPRSTHPMPGRWVCLDSDPGPQWKGFSSAQFTKAQGKAQEVPPYVERTWQSHWEGSQTGSGTYMGRGWN